MKLEIEIPDNDAELIKQFTGATTDENNSHGVLTIASLVTLLLEDVMWMQRRPGCWEAETMRNLLASHGYEDATYGGGREGM